MKLFITQFSPSSCSFLPLCYEYIPQDPVVDTLNLSDQLSHPHKTRLALHACSNTRIPTPLHQLCNQTKSTTIPWGILSPMYVRSPEIHNVIKYSYNCLRHGHKFSYFGRQVNKISTLPLAGRDSAVGIATHYGLDGPGIESRWRRDFPHPPRAPLGTTEPPIQWVPGLSQE